MKTKAEKVIDIIDETLGKEKSLFWRNALESKFKYKKYIYKIFDNPNNGNLISKMANDIYEDCTIYFYKETQIEDKWLVTGIVLYNGVKEGK